MIQKANGISSRFFAMDMQKDWILPAINSVKLNPTGANVPIHVDIQSFVINGETWNQGSRQIPQVRDDLT